MTFLESPSRRATRALIDLHAIEGNVRAVLASLSPGVELMAVVKANAYGHGARMTTEAAMRAGAHRLGVATLDEALLLRRHGIRAPIQILGPVVVEEAEAAAEFEIDISAGSMEFVDQLGAISASKRARVQLKVDTGLHRFGVEPDEAVVAVSRLASNPGVEFAGIFTHFGQADEVDPTPTKAQVERFRVILDAVRAADLPTGLVHAANSAGLLRSREFDFDMVRLGISLYGIAPSPDVTLLRGMRTAMTVVSRVQRVFELQPGDGVSYGATFRASTPMRAALVPVGYGDGYLRSLSNRGFMRLAGKQAPVLGRVCMDQTVVGIPDDVDVVVNNEIIVAGGLESDRVRFETIAERAGTNPYEIVTAVSARVPRIYSRGGHVVAVEDLNGLHRLG